jgi:protein-disulfide isomerase
MFDLTSDAFPHHSMLEYDNLERNISKPLAISLATFAGFTVIAVVGCQPSESPDGPAGKDTPSAVSAGNLSRAESEDDSQAVATIGDRTITMSELDTFIKDGLFASQSGNGDPAKVYEMRSKALGRLIEHAVLGEASSAKGLSPDEFLEESVPKESEIPDGDINAYYEANRDKMGDATLEEIGPRIRAHLRAQLAADLILKLTEGANSAVLLKPARTEVAAIGPSQGPDDAPITIIEFSDFECPYCKRVVPTLHQIVEKYPEQVRIVFRHLPLDGIHARARPAAEASACADKQDKFWEFHDILFENNEALSDEDFAKYAGDAGLDVEAFNECVADREFQTAVQNDAEAAAALGLRGTPAFFVNGISMRGAKPIGDFVRVIDTELALQQLAAPSS